MKYANDGTTILSEKTLTYQEMESSLPVQGDGSTHYYNQGPVFVDDPDPVMQEQPGGIRAKIRMQFREKTWVRLRGQILRICATLSGVWFQEIR